MQFGKLFVLVCGVAHASLDSDDEVDLLQVRASTKSTSTTGSQQHLEDDDDDDDYIEQLKTIGKRLEKVIIQELLNEVSQAGTDFTSAFSALYPDGLPSDLDSNSDNVISEDEVVGTGRLKEWHARWLYESHLPPDSDGIPVARIQYGETLDLSGDGLITEIEFLATYGQWLDEKATAELESAQRGAGPYPEQEVSQVVLEDHDDDPDDENDLGLLSDGELLAEAAALQENWTVLPNQRAMIEFTHNGKRLRARRTRNQKQKKWLKKQIMKLQPTICGRHNFPIPVTHKRNWAPWNRRRRCPDGYNDWGIMCGGCQGETELFGACWEKCGANKMLPHLNTHCDLGVVAYCTASAGDCVTQATQIIISVATMVASINPGSKALAKGARMASKSLKRGDSYWTAAKVFYRNALRAKVNQLKTQAKNNLKRYMKKNGRDIAEDAAEDIMYEALEAFAAQSLMGNHEHTDWAAIAGEIVSAVDPTGIYDAVMSFDGGQRCRDVMIDPFPEEDYEPNPIYPVDYDEYAEEGKCCNGDLGTKNNAQNPWDCEADCKAKSNCNFFSHHDANNQCVFCETCNVQDSTAWTSWVSSSVNAYHCNGAHINVLKSDTTARTCNSNWYPQRSNYNTKICYGGRCSADDCCQHSPALSTTVTCQDEVPSCSDLTKSGSGGSSYYFGGKCTNKGSYHSTSYRLDSCYTHTTSRLTCAQAKCCDCVDSATRGHQARNGYGEFAEPSYGCYGRECGGGGGGGYGYRGGRLIQIEDNESATDVP